ncbi:hypothetical protein Ahu01nite_034010 [Winogradskya humida]|uniref:Poly(3-hydroxyalkanoate) polymerase subunit PhaE n=2 Tax=Winogradskya humida TaxID=113566 RepID=A0ABQ3ZNY7_9ACTN|nr:hypothetical protein Ahu01nite_034010 [Actinoplanes humidus]
MQLDAQFQQWRQDARTAVYGAVAGSFRELMTAWWALRDGRRRDADVNEPLHQRALAAYAGFNSDLGKAQLLTDDVLFESIRSLSAAVQAFDELAETMDFVHRQRWTTANDEQYEQTREAAEAACKAFLGRAREQLAKKPALVPHDERERT